MTTNQPKKTAQNRKTKAEASNRPGRKNAQHYTMVRLVGKKLYAKFTPK